MDIFNMMTVNVNGICRTFSGVIQLFGYIFLIIKIATPITLIVVGMIQMIKAITAKDEEAIKKAQRGLIKKTIAAVSVFLVITVVNLLMGVMLKNTDYQNCASCFNDPATECHGATNGQVDTNPSNPYMQTQ